MVRHLPNISVFRGYIVPRYERLAWIPVLVVYVVALGIGGKHLINPPPAEPSSASAILSFASTIAGFVITYSPLASDFTTYFRPDVSRCTSLLPPCYLDADRVIKLENILLFLSWVESSDSTYHSEPPDQLVFKGCYLGHYPMLGRGRSRGYPNGPLLGHRVCQRQCWRIDRSYA